MNHMELRAIRLAQRGAMWPVAVRFTMLALFGICNPGILLAQCLPANPAPGGTVNCSGVDNDGFSDTDANLTVNVQTGAQVNNTAAAISVIGGNASVTNNGTISTTGGVLAAGIAGVSNNVFTNAGSITTTGSASLGMSGSNNNSFTNRGSIATSGPAAVGMGVADSNTVINSGTVSTSGSAAVGISVVNSNSVTNSGTIATTGPNADGIDAGNNNNIVNSGTIQVSGTGSNSVDFGTGTNSLQNQASGIINGRLEGGSGNDTVTNAGRFTGDIDLGAGTNSLSNQADGQINAGTILNLGAGSSFSNSGRLAPGGAGAIATTAVTGNYVQSASGTLDVDVDMSAGTSDRVNVSGTANLEGSVEPRVKNPVPGSRQVTILSAAGGTTNSGLVASGSSPALRTSLSFPNATDVVLGIDIDFSVPGGGLNTNQASVGNNLNAVLGSGGGALGALVNAMLLDVNGLTGYTEALDQLSAEAYLNTATASLFAAEEFSNNLFSCRVAGTGLAFIAEDRCAWIRFEGRSLDRNRTANHIGFAETSGAFSIGAQFDLGQGWFAGAGFGYEKAFLRTDTGVDSDSDRFNFGGIVKYQTGPLLLAASVTGGVAEFETQRRLNVGAISARPNADHDVSYVAGQVRAAYLVTQSNWYLKPLVDLNLTYLDRDGINERNGGLANLLVEGGDDVFFSATPALELGAEFGIGKLAMQPFVKAGVTLFEKRRHSLNARFSGAPAGVGSFSINSEFDDVFADIESGVVLLDSEGLFTVTVAYEGRISNNMEQHGGALKGNLSF